MSRVAWFLAGAVSVLVAAVVAVEWTFRKGER